MIQLQKSQRSRNHSKSNYSTLPLLLLRAAAAAHRGLAAKRAQRQYRIPDRIYGKLYTKTCSNSSGPSILYCTSRGVTYGRASCRTKRELRLLLLTTTTTAINSNRRICYCLLPLGLMLLHVYSHHKAGICVCWCVFQRVVVTCAHVSYRTMWSSKTSYHGNHTSKSPGIQSLETLDPCITLYPKPQPQTPKPLPAHQECLAEQNGTKVFKMHGLHPWRVGNPKWNLTAACLTMYVCDYNYDCDDDDDDAYDYYYYYYFHYHSDSLL